MYWLGNTAKTKITNEILAMPGNLVVFDYGCGDGGDWPAVLRDHPRIGLVGYEPSAERADKARSALRGLNAVVIDEPRDVTADVIVSFSVFEHVYDRATYLRNAKRALKPGGVFYLNYDDGHFRSPAVKERIQNFAAGPLAVVGVIDPYQARVVRVEVEELAIAAGFDIDSSFYSNVNDLKILFRSIQEADRQAFVSEWLSFEERLSRFCANTAPYCGDTANLWRVMPSRTLRLRHR